MSGRRPTSPSDVTSRAAGVRALRATKEGHMTLAGKKIAILATDMFEQVELVEPRKALKEAGATTEIVSLKPGQIQGFNHYDKADKFDVDRTVEQASADDYDALLQPGGVGNPDALRMDENAVHFFREFFDQGKPAAV